MINNDDKVNIAVKCPNSGCDALISFKKKITLSHIEINCPRCSKRISIDFDTETLPQTFKAKVVGEPMTDQNKQNNKGKKDTIYGKDRNVTPHIVHQLDDYDLFEREEQQNKTPPRKRRLRDNIYLTHIRCFGLVKERYKLTEGKTIIGRLDDEMPSDISLLGDKAISRQSIVISIEADEYGFDYKLKVKNATNPIKVNDHRLKIGEEIFLEFGDIIKLGNSKLLFDKK